MGPEPQEHSSIKLSRGSPSAPAHLLKDAFGPLKPREPIRAGWHLNECRCGINHPEAQRHPTPTMRSRPRKRRNPTSSRCSTPARPKPRPIGFISRSDKVKWSQHALQGKRVSRSRDTTHATRQRPSRCPRWWPLGVLAGGQEIPRFCVAPPPVVRWMSGFAARPGRGRSVDAFVAVKQPGGLCRQLRAAGFEGAIDPWAR